MAIYGQSGYLTQVVGENLHLPAWQLSSVLGMSVLGAAVSLPVAYLTARAALSSTGSALEDAARAAGAGPLRVIARVTVPLLRPAMLNSAVLIFALCLEILGLPLFVGHRRTSTSTPATCTRRGATAGRRTRRSSAQVPCCSSSSCRCCW